MQDISIEHYRNLVDEAARRNITFERRMQVKEELKTIRRMKRIAKPKVNIITDLIESDYTFNDNQYAFVCD